MKKYKPKPWNRIFHVGKWLHQLEVDSHRGRCGDWVESLTVLSNETGGPVTKRFYSDEGGARRGAAQIYNTIERQLLG